MARTLRAALGFVSREAHYPKNFFVVLCGQLAFGGVCSAIALPGCCKLQELRATMEASRNNLKARPEEPGAWEVSIGFASDAQPRPFEATITVESEAVTASAVKRCASPARSRWARFGFSN